VGHESGPLGQNRRNRFFRVGSLRLREDHELFASVGDDRRRHDATDTDVGNTVERFFEELGGVVAPAQHDFVAIAAGEEELPSLDEAFVTGVEPAVDEGARGRVGVSEIAAHNRRPAHQHPADTVPGYPYSETLTGSDIVWTEESIDALFDLGPDDYIPGSKMPMQRIASAEDRRDLIAFLRGTVAAKEN